MAKSTRKLTSGVLTRGITSSQKGALARRGQGFKQEVDKFLKESPEWQGKKFEDFSKLSRSNKITLLNEWVTRRKERLTGAKGQKTIATQSVPSTVATSSEPPKPKPSATSRVSPVPSTKNVPYKNSNEAWEFYIAAGKPGKFMAFKNKGKAPGAQMKYAFPSKQEAWNAWTKAGKPGKFGEFYITGGK